MASSTIKRTTLLYIYTFAAILSAFGQHVSYRSTAHYNKKVIEFEKRYSEISSTSIVMLGNSLTEFGKDWNERLGTPSGTVVNRGIMGDNTRGILERLCQITPYHPQAIFLMAGINDVTRNYTAEGVFLRIRAIIDSIRVQSPSTRLYVQSLLPINLNVKTWKPLIGQTNKIPAINALLEAYCQEQEIVYIDIFSHLVTPGTNVLRRGLTGDGLHLNEEGYAIWVNELKKYLSAYGYAPTSYIISRSGFITKSR